MAQGKTAAIPPEVVARHVLALHPDADWPVWHGAMEAVLRRCGFGKRDQLLVSQRPANRQPFGIYQTRRKRSAPRPYTTLITGIEPIRASCNCADFVRNSLGLCKHSLTIVSEIFKRPRVTAKALGLQTAAIRPVLTWDPVRPLAGDGDWLARVELHTNGVGVTDRVLQRALRHFLSDNGTSKLRSSHPSDIEKRFALVDDIGALLAAEKAADPALSALLDAEHRRLRQLRDGRLGPAEIRAAIGSMKKMPYRYQRAGIARFFETGRLLLADDMGLGKTVQAIAACHVLWITKQIRRGMVVVPASLKSQWLREWTAFTTAPVAVVDGSPDERRAIYRKSKRGFLLINYELLLRDFEEIRKCDPELVVLDEAQRIKNWATKTATYVKRLSPRYRLVLTGTPMENRLDELASIFDWVDSFALEPKWRLVPWHTVYGDGVSEIRGARNLDTLRARLAPSMIRRTRKEVLDQLPSRTDTIVPVDLTSEQRDEHDSLSQPISSLVSRARRRPLTQAEFLRLMSLLTTQRIIANGLAQLRFPDIWTRLAQSAPDSGVLSTLQTPKLLDLRQILEQVVIQQGRKVVVFSQWRRMLQLADWATSDLLAAAGKRVVFFTGKETQKRRTQNIVDLHDDPATCVLFATDSGGVGLNLQRAATCCVNIDLPWNPAVLEQRIGRIYRLGQEQPISVYNLVSQHSIEERIAGLIADKRALFAGIFEGSSDSVSFDRSGSFLSQLERIVNPPAVPVGEEDDDIDGEQPALDRELDELVAAADESCDPPQSAATAVSSEVADLPATGELQGLLAQLAITTKPDGGLSIDAPPGAATALATLFEEAARILRRQAESP
jgi:superfamily II DNA or RNA helicase